jgi:hypothetical protein
MPESMSSDSLEPGMRRDVGLISGSLIITNPRENDFSPCATHDFRGPVCGFTSALLENDSYEIVFTRLIDFRY